MRFWPQRKPPIEEKATLASPEDWLFELFGALDTASGLSVSPSTAMRSTPVRSAVQCISEPIGFLPLHVYRRLDGDGRERETEHPVAKVLRDPNEWTTASDFREQMQRDCLLWGNAFAFINWVDGKPKEFVRLDPAAVSVSQSQATGEPIYKMAQPQGEARLLARTDVFHLKAPSVNGYYGESPVTQCKEAITLALVMEKHAGKLFGSGARPAGVITLDKALGDKGQQNLKTSFRAAHDGPDNAGKTLVLPVGARFIPITFASTDAQFLELWQHAITEIARIFRVPPHLLYELGRATWGNAGEMGQAFVSFTLSRWLKAWTDEIRLKLFTPEERDAFYAEFLLDDLLKADTAARAEAYAKMIAARIINPNEARAMENRPPYEGGNVFANPNTTTTAPGAA